MKHQIKKFIFLLGDLFVLHAALALTLFVRYRLIGGVGGVAPYWQAHWGYFAGVFVIFILSFYINDLYSLRRMASARLFAKQTINSVIAASLLAVIYFYIYPRVDIAPKTNLAIFAVIAFIGFLIWRRLAFWMTQTDTWQNNLGIIGYNEEAAALIADLQSRPSLGYQTALVFRSLEDLHQLETQIREKNIRTLVLVDDFESNPELRQALFALLRHQVTYFSYEDFYEMLNQKVPVASINQNWFLENLREGEKKYFDSIKRLSDLALAFFGLIISLPFWPLIAVLVKLGSRGPVFFTQNRVGKNGLIFKLYKFRSMRVANNDFAMTTENDARISASGRFLRTSRLDEIPQLLNIIKGEMSFIGPRPERPELSTELEEKVPFYTTRLLIKPGLTGWDQISGEYHSPSIEDTLKKLQNDLYYIKHRSLYLDFSIILKTVATVLGRRGR
ncbi:MAG: sugar transferase [bacterium]|nr:sugar transferase [bacterium]